MYVAVALTSGPTCDVEKSMYCACQCNALRSRRTELATGSRGRRASSAYGVRNTGERYQRIGITVTSSIAAAPGPASDQIARRCGMTSMNADRDCRQHANPNTHQASARTRA